MPITGKAPVPDTSITRLPQEGLREAARLSTLIGRYLTKAGVGIQAITAAATSKAITFALTEPDALYGVLATPNWSTTCYVSALATSGFTLNFGTAAPGGGGKVTWAVVRG